MIAAIHKTMRKMLLRWRPKADDDAPFPYRQLFILALCRICEPIAFMSIFPYIYFMIKSFNITDEEPKIAVYAGMVTSSFALAEFMASIMWGRLSDRVGRKPILLLGLAGTGVSMLMFGFAKSLPMALFARALGGILNGNIGVLQTTVAEVITAEHQKSRAFSIMPFVWCLGTILGAAIGGTLAEPVHAYPSIFKKGGLFDIYPYLLPNLFCAVCVVFGVTVGFLFLEETHQEKKSRRDVGVEMGSWILRRLNLGHAAPRLPAEDKTALFLSSDEKMAEAGLLPPGPLHLGSRRKPLYSFRQLFSNQVLLNILGFFILAFHTISFEQLLPIMFSAPISDTKPQLPFKFLTGFDLDAATVGTILSWQGALQIVAQLAIFPAINSRYGSLFTFRVAVLGYPLLYFFVPYLGLVPDHWRYPAIGVMLLWKVTAQALAYPSTNIMLADAAPALTVLGTLNGVAASSASLARACGPLVSGAAQTHGAAVGYSGLAWWTCAAVAVAGAVVSLYQTHEIRNRDAAADEGDARVQPAAAGAGEEAERECLLRDSEDPLTPLIDSAVADYESAL